MQTASSSSLRTASGHNPVRYVKPSVAHKWQGYKWRGTLKLSAQHSLAAKIVPRPGRALVIAVDNTELSWESVKFTVEELYRDGDVLHLLHVIAKEEFTMPVPPAALCNMSYSSMDMDYEELLFQHAREFIKETMVGLASARKARCEIDLVHGNNRQSIGDMIIAKSEALNASIIVVPGHHSPSIWEQLFAGGGASFAFSTHVAKYSRVPTLIYQPASSVRRQEKQQIKQEVEQEEELLQQVPLVVR